MKQYTPSVMEIHSPLVCRRRFLKLEDFKKFKLSSRSFKKQYSGIYVARLRVLKDHLAQKAKDKWGKILPEGYISLSF